MKSASVSNLDVVGNGGHPEVGTGTGRALAPAARPASPALLQMWAGLMRGAWRSIAIVPGSPGITAREVAHGLAELARIRGVGPYQIVDATGISAGDGPGLAREITGRKEAAGRAVILVDAPVLHLGGIPVVQAADAVLLALPLGAIDEAARRNTLDIVGRQRVVGQVVMQSAEA